MTGIPRRSYEIKLDRADEHIQAFRNAISVRGHDASDLFIRKIDHKTGEWVVTLGEIPRKLPAIVGDALQNLRSTLDHLVTDLVMAYTADPSRHVLESCAFPVYGHRAMPPDAKRDLIGAIHPDAQDIIEAMQPSLLDTQYNRHWLWKLHDLARIDRHRVVLSGVQAGLGSGLSGGNLNIVHYRQGGGSLEPGAEIARYLIRPTDPNRPMYVDFEYTANVTFGDGPLAGVSIGDTLDDFHARVVDDVLTPLVPFLDVPRLGA